MRYRIRQQPPPVNYTAIYTLVDPTYTYGSTSPGTVSVIDGSYDKVAAGVIFSLNPANSGKIICNSSPSPLATNTYIYLDNGTSCIAKPRGDFEFNTWTESPLTNRNSSIPVESSISPESITIDRYGIFTAKFKQPHPLSSQELFTYLTGAISAAVAINGALLVASNIPSNNYTFEVHELFTTLVRGKEVSSGPEVPTYFNMDVLKPLNLIEVTSQFLTTNTEYTVIILLGTTLGIFLPLLFYVWKRERQYILMHLNKVEILQINSTVMVGSAYFRNYT